MAQGQRRAVDYNAFWTGPQKDVPTWQTQVFKYDYGGANPGPDVMPAEDLAEAARQVILEDINTIARYPPTYGPVRTREVIAKKMRNHRGISWADPDNILVTNGSAQGILLGIETMTKPGDIVITDRFFYQGAVRTFRNSGLQMVTIDRDEHGMRMDLLEEAFRNLKRQGKRAKFIYTIPSPQNPDGSIMPLERRERMLALAHEHDTLIMEDDCYVDQALDVDEMPPAIASLDGGQERVVYIATFSKIISPGVRVAWVSAAKPVVERFAAYKQDVGNDYLSGLIVAKYLEDHMDDRIEWLNQRMRHKRDTMVAALGENFGPQVRVEVPKGGMFIWAEFPQRTNMKAMESVTQAEGVRYLAGYQFSPTGEGDNRARLNYSWPTPQEITDGIGLLAKVLRREKALPE
jgi:2-aminoadipate transaminase